MKTAQPQRVDTTRQLPLSCYAKNRAPTTSYTLNRKSLCQANPPHATQSNRKSPRTATFPQPSCVPTFASNGCCINNNGHMSFWILNKCILFYISFSRFCFTEQVPESSYTLSSLASHLLNPTLLQYLCSSFFLFCLLQFLF
ncbi:hypothetical protein I3843_05G154500 [Carya illinoinensis]|nr:hypothetical protein I3843_05G154500 [Carya illinoinensis]